MVSDDYRLRDATTIARGGERRKDLVKNNTTAA